MTSEPLPPLDLLPLRLRGSRLVSHEEYRVLRRLEDSGNLVCIPKPRFYGMHFLVALSMKSEHAGAREGRSPLGDNWFLYSRTIYPQTLQFFLHVAREPKTVLASPRASEDWHVGPEVGFTGASHASMILTPSEERVLKALLETPLATGREVAERLGMSYAYTRRVLASLRDKRVWENVVCFIRKAGRTGGFVQLFMLVDREWQGQVMELLGLRPGNSRFLPLSQFAWRGRVWVMGFVVVSGGLVGGLVKKLVGFPRAFLSSDYVLRVGGLSMPVPLSH